ncbi:MAG: hypothetical protein LV481_10995 [Methylacidiphilales bacterium]|nr:hypothetical protein [Candidatus Methylacidiphilales bacterium]
MFTDPKFKPTPEQKLMALEHVLYEMEMFIYLKILNLGTTSLKHAGIVNNAIVEAYLLHARVLNDFFSKTPKKDDISCTHYCFKISEAVIAEEIENRFHKSLAHLTYSRLCFTGDTKAWIDSKIYPPLAYRIKAFSTRILLRPNLNPTLRSRFSNLNTLLTAY